MRRWQLVIDDTGSVEGIYAFIYCAKWRSGQVLPMSYGLTNWLTTLRDRATQLLIKYKSGALVTQCEQWTMDGSLFLFFVESIFVILSNPRLFLVTFVLLLANLYFHCVTRAPLLYFIWSWVALSFKVASEWVRQASVTPVQIYKGTNVLYWPSIIKYQLLPPHSVLYWPSTQLHHLVTHSWANWI